MDNLQIVLKFADHGIQNLARLHNIRHLLYGLYFAMIAAFLPIFFYGAKDTEYLLLIAAAIGQALIIFQLAISLQIRVNYDGLRELFDTVPLIKEKNSRAEKILNKHDPIKKPWSPMKRPFSIGILFMFCANLILLGMFINSKEHCCLIGWITLFLNCLRCIGYILIATIPVVFYYFYFRKFDKAFDELKGNTTANRASDHESPPDKVS